MWCALSTVQGPGRPNASGIRLAQRSVGADDCRDSIMPMKRKLLILDQFSKSSNLSKMKLFVLSWACSKDWAWYSSSSMLEMRCSASFSLVACSPIWALSCCMPALTAFSTEAGRGVLLQPGQFCQWCGPQYVVEGKKAVRRRGADRRLPPFQAPFPRREPSNRIRGLDLRPCRERHRSHVRKGAVFFHRPFHGVTGDAWG